MMQILANTARLMLAEGKGLLAIDESVATCNKRFAELGIDQTESARQNWRELMITTPNLAECISGVILYDETIRQHQQNHSSFSQAISAAGMVPGIKVDTGSKALAGHEGEQVSEGLDCLRERLQEYSAMGVRFAKWRAVITVGEHLPSLAGIDANAHALARYAALCQEAGLVPVVEPEVLMTGSHSLAQCQAVTETVLRCVFGQLARQGVALEGMILKGNMVLPGLNCEQQAGLMEVAEATLNCLLRTVPAAVPGIAFLSGGQSAQLASARLQAISSLAPICTPWCLTFSFARALQQPALAIWAGRPENRLAAQQALLHRARCNQAARRQEYSPVMETAA